MIRDRMAAEAPVRSGRLVRSITIVHKGPDEVAVGPTVDYAHFPARGTRPHVILPRRARALRFVVDGEVVFARRVFHPGVKPNPYDFRTRDAVAPFIQIMAEKIVEEELSLA